MPDDAVLVLTPVTGGFYFGDVVAGMHREAVRAGLRLVVQQTYDAGTRATAPGDAPTTATPLAWDQVAGAVTVSTAVDRGVVERLRRHGLPVVSASEDVVLPRVPPGGDLASAGLASASPDNAAGTRAAVRHLAEHGHTRIGFVGNLGQADMRERYAGYHEAMLELGLAPDPAHFLATADHGEASGEHAAAGLALLDEPPTAVVCATDRNALGVVAGLARVGLRVPQDVAVVGFDGIEAAAYCVPALTTVDQPFHATGAYAMRLLRALREGRDPDGEPRHPVALVRRSSCGCPGEAVAVREDVVRHDGADDPVGVLRHGLAAALEHADGPAGPEQAVEDALREVAAVVEEALRTGTTPAPARMAAALRSVTDARLLPGGTDRAVGALTAHLTLLAEADEAARAEAAPTEPARTEAAPDEAARQVLRAMLRRMPAVLSHVHAGQYLRRAHGAEAALVEQHDVGVALLGHGAGDPRWLTWMSRTGVRAGVLALWRGDRLVVEGVYDPHRTLRVVAGDASTAACFPSSDVLAAARPEQGEAVYVVPVRARGRDWGVLAVVGSVDDNLRRESYNQWAALLCASFEQEDLARSLRSSEERYALLASAMNEGLWDWDLEGGDINLSARCVALLGLEHVPEPERGAQWARGVHPDDLDGLLADLRRTARTGTTLQEREFRYRGPSDVTWRWLLSRAMPLGAHPAGTGSPRLLGSLSDHTHRKGLEEELRRHASVDPITGLANRRAFLERLTTSVRRATAGTPFAVLFLDLDRFKVINDSLGHQTGDRLLRAVSDRLREAVRPADTAARFGGDEFAVLLDGLPPEHVPAVVQRIREALSRPVEVTGHSLWVTASVGIALSSAGYESAEDVLRDADTAMYDAKVRERGSVSYFDSSMHDAALQHLWLQDQVQRALERQEFEVHYQPIVALAGDDLTRFEALVRWRHPERGLVPPAEFLPLMEETGLVVALGRWLVDRVARDVAGWRRAHAGPVTVSVNLSDREFWDADLVPTTLATLTRHGLGPEHLALEITERVIARSPELADRMVRRFRDAGLSLHIDDFGTGHSSLQTLQRYPVDALKIDRSFVAELADDARSQELVRAVVAMGRALDLDVVAEGVETVEQLRALRAIGCASAQGYLFSRAVPADEARRLLGRPVPALVAEDARRTPPTPDEPVA
ncbi:EAL domain-containing protein [Cellulomonas marina]|uniref:Diguanylate cyclase (GGDEF) domain-containing protein n=1 Tax=Cellulomonas marina TaxID=988821 RepID=A0A1I0XEG2_9CELL|nr:EAL domain-containing protein [Cellulomonas marina]GIG29874.1 hypothetical protein Cma02nite_24740 [Cellulomonas marina]SFA99459.1 diguanylate cyclase (GGDEF) domain-containing protein [Cellulomonas marina]